MINDKKGIISKSVIKRISESTAHFFGSALIIYTILVVAIVYIALRQYEKNQGGQRTHANNVMLVNFLAASAASSLESGNKEDLFYLADRAKEKEDFLYCSIMNAEGNPLVYRGKKVSGTIGMDRIAENAVLANQPLHQVYKDPSGKETIIEYSHPVSVAGRKLGTVRLGLEPHTPSPFSLVNDYRIVLTLFTIFPLLFLFYYLCRNSLRPLSVLQEKLEEMITRGECPRLISNESGENGTIDRLVHNVITFFKDRLRDTEKARKDLEVSSRVIAYEKKKIENILDYIDDGVLAINKSGKITYMNKSSEQTLEISSQKAIGTAVEESVQNEALRSFIKQLKTGDNRFGANKQSVFTNTISEGGTFRFICTPLKNMAGDETSELVVMKDVTAQSRADQARSEFVSHVAHEIRSPLNTIKSYTEMLLDGDVKNQETEKEFYNVITMETERLAKLVEDLLNISYIEMGNLTINRGIVRPLNLIENCIAAVMSQAVHKNIQINKIVPDSLSSLDIDKGLIEVALHNCIGNAIKYTPEGGTITVQAEEDSERAFFSVKDTGPGISEEDLPNIFNKFYRSSDDFVRDKKGNGLGLSLAKEILTLHGGDIKAESNKGEGSTFTFIIPRETHFERMF